MAWGTDNPVLSYETDSPGPERTKGMGKSGLIRTSLQLGAGETQVISYAVSGSLLSKEDAIETYTRLLKEKTKLLHEKQQSLANLLEVSHISLPDKHLENTYNWVRLNTRWLEMDLDGYGRFLGAGAIEYPWLFGCDNSYALQGVLATGDFELAKSTLTMLKNVSEKVNGNGRIIHEMSSNGYVYNKGNTQETAHFIIAVWKTFLWTGDITFLQDLYPYAKKGIHWLTVDMDANQNLFPEGYGIMEVHGLNAELIDVAVYTQQALEAASQMAKLFHEDSVSDAYARQATLLKDKINRDFWDEAEGIYCDFFGTKEQAVSVAKGAIRQLRSGTSDAEKETIRFYESLLTRFHQLPDGTQQGWFTNKNWVITTPLETAIAPPDKALRSLDKIRNEHCGEYGPYLSAVEGNRMMTISTGVQAVSEAQYGRMDECLWYMNRIAATLHSTLPGSINEMMPDYGCPVQAWTIYSITVPLIMHMFGITPDAYHKEVIISPALPTSWKEAKLENQRIGSNRYDIEISRSGGKTIYLIKSQEANWKNIIRIKGLSGKEYELNGKTMLATGDDILLTGTENQIRF
ncbi:MAG: amylo-alpha-1,6-glucosidase [Tannerellaceae bacterium]|nr:amylo-alpha-1,6-glucosidase [Tannerellaceae bacterium]